MDLSPDIKVAIVETAIPLYGAAVIGIPATLVGFQEWLRHPIRRGIGYLIICSGVGIAIARHLFIWALHTTLGLSLFLQNDSWLFAYILVGALLSLPWKDKPQPASTPAPKAPSVPKKEPPRIPDLKTDKTKFYPSEKYPTAPDHPDLPHNLFRIDHLYARYDDLSYEIDHNLFCENDLIKIEDHFDYENGLTVWVCAECGLGQIYPGLIGGYLELTVSKANAELMKQGSKSQLYYQSHWPAGY